MLGSDITSRMFEQLGTTQAQNHITLIVDEENQIVYSRGCSENAIADSTPGALLSCIHAHDLPGGCGTTQWCMYCGAGTVLKQSRKEKRPFERECSIRRENADEEDLNYRVYASPFDLEGHVYVLLDLEDISDTKRREALERVFYHDILNTATGLRVYLDLLKQEVPEGESGKLVHTLDEISVSLVDEITSQRMLSSAEKGTLEVQPNLVTGSEISKQTIALLRGDAARRNIKIAHVMESENFALITDAAILKRVLVNTIKNAVEASIAGDTVTVTCRKSGDAGEFRIHNNASIPDSVRLQLFYRYYSTKGANRGLGTYSMLLFTEKYLRGYLTLETDESAGTTITIALPADVRSNA
jgi:signal transduction histidine kinase